MNNHTTQTVVVECLVPGGDGLARLADGRPVFVTGAVPGDELVIRQLADKKSYARAETWDLAKPSDERREPPCPVASDCGGCDLMALGELAQSRAKVEILRQALARTGGIHELPGELEVASCGSSLGYRSRVRLHLENGAVGFFARGSRRLVSFDECAVCSPELTRAVARLREYVQGAAPAFECFAEAEVRAFAESELVSGALPSLCLYLAEGISKLPSAAQAQVQALEAEFQVAVVQLQRGRARVVVKSDSLTRVRLSELDYLSVGVGAFSQVNWSVNQGLVKELLSGAAARKVGSFLDLYCGAGNFSLPLLRAGLSGVGVESSSQSIKLARETARQQGLKGGRFIAADVEPAVARLLKEAPRFELALLDPPRAGAKRVLPALCKLKPKVIFMCSCDPVTFARDLKTLIAAGYELEQVCAYDMFPQTHHLEAVAWLSLTPENSVQT